jgi:nucleoside-diphosphate-sugar epimerase
MHMASGPIAILGATSQIARDFATRFAPRAGVELHLYGRNAQSRPYAQFGQDKYAAVINFVGVGDPTRAKEMGADIFAVTRQFDLLALDYLSRYPDTRYIFLSSGAVYGQNFAEGVSEASAAHVPVNALQPQDYYAEAKRYAEALHRSRPESIFDLRVFNYISRTMDLSARFLIADMINAVRDGTVFKTTSRPLKRDFLHPADFCRLIECCLKAPDGNVPLDCYSQAPISKEELIALMVGEFGMKCEIAQTANVVNATGEKPNYFSRNIRAAGLGYAPAYSSHSAIREEVAAILMREN